MRTKSKIFGSRAIHDEIFLVTLKAANNQKVERIDYYNVRKKTLYNKEVLQIIRNSHYSIMHSYLAGT